MTDHSDFLAAIIDRPDDDLPRLVYADFLEESGDEMRAEFIRVHCELERLPADDGARPALLKRGLELFIYRGAWIIPGMTATKQHFRRGFVESMETTAESVVEFANVIFTTTPLRHLRAINSDGPVDRFVRIENLARLVSLDVSNGSSSTVSQIVHEASLTNLRRLAVRNCRIWSEGLVAISQSAVIERLAALDLAGNPLADEGMETIAHNSNFSGLTSLILRGDDQAEERCIHAEGAQSLANSRTLTNLEILDLSGNYLGDTGLFNLSTATNFARVRDLNLADNELGQSGNDAYTALLRSPHWVNLQRLNLSKNQIEALLVPTLQEWIRARSGRILDLRNLRYSAETQRLLLSAPEATSMILDMDFDEETI